MDRESRKSGGKNYLWELCFHESVRFPLREGGISGEGFECSGFVT